MKWLFDSDGAFARAMDNVGRLAALNVLFIVCSLPVVTLGASQAALYGCLQKWQRGSDKPMAALFFAAWRENGKKATLAWLPILLFAALCTADLLVAQSVVWRVIAVLGLQVDALAMTLVFPLLARYENTVGNHLKNAIRLAVGHLPRVLLIWLLWAVPIAGCLLWGMVLYVLLPVWLLLGYAGISYAAQKLLWPVFDALEQKNEE